MPIIASSIAEFTSPGTYSWTVPAGVTSLYVISVGAGGGGAGGSDGGYGHSGPGGAGGSAGKRTDQLISVSPGQSLSITVPTGGAGGASNCYIGEAGGTGGNATVSGAFGTVTATGGAGAPENRHDSFSGTPTPGIAGEASSFGAGGAGGAQNLAGSTGGIGAGGGGGGQVSGSCVAAAAGGAGGPGFVSISIPLQHEDFTAPGTYYRIVPAGSNMYMATAIGGGGGGQGGNGNYSGAGGAGAGGKAGSKAVSTFPVVTNDIVTITVGAGGSGGVTISADTSPNGTAGGTGSVSTVAKYNAATIVSAAGGAGGNKATAAGVFSNPAGFNYTDVTSTIDPDTGQTIVTGGSWHTGYNGENGPTGAAGGAGGKYEVAGSSGGAPGAGGGGGSASNYSPNDYCGAGGAGGGGAVYIRIPLHTEDFTTPGTYYRLVPDGISSFRGTTIGGGGGGGGASTNNNWVEASGSAGSGGGGGGFSSTLANAVSGEIISIVVGAGGAGATSRGLTGQPGASSSIFKGSAVLVTAGGGYPGTGGGTSTGSVPGKGGSGAQTNGGDGGQGGMAWANTSGGGYPRAATAGGGISGGQAGYFDLMYGTTQFGGGGGGSIGVTVAGVTSIGGNGANVKTGSFNGTTGAGGGGGGYISGGGGAGGPGFARIEVGNAPLAGFVRVAKGDKIEPAVFKTIVDRMNAECDRRGEARLTVQYPTTTQDITAAFLNTLLDKVQAWGTLPETADVIVGHKGQPVASLPASLPLTSPSVIKASDVNDLMTAIEAAEVDPLVIRFPSTNGVESILYSFPLNTAYATMNPMKFWYTRTGTGDIAYRVQSITTYCGNNPTFTGTILAAAVGQTIDAGLKVEYIDFKFDWNKGCCSGNNNNVHVQIRVRMTANKTITASVISSSADGQWGC